MKDSQAAFAGPTFSAGVVSRISGAQKKGFAGGAHRMCAQDLRLPFLACQGVLFLQPLPPVFERLLVLCGIRGPPEASMAPKH